MDISDVRALAQNRNAVASDVYSNALTAFNGEHGVDFFEWYCWLAQTARWWRTPSMHSVSKQFAWAVGCAVDGWLQQLLEKEVLAEAISFESTDGSDYGIRRANYAYNKGVNLVGEMEDSQFLSGAFDKAFVYGTNCMSGVWALPNNKAFWGNIQELALTEQ